jgi:hypothetical protein
MAQWQLFATFRHPHPIRASGTRSTGLYEALAWLLTAFGPSGECLNCRNALSPRRASWGWPPRVGFTRLALMHHPIPLAQDSQNTCGGHQGRLFGATKAGNSLTSAGNNYQGRDTRSRSLRLLPTGNFHGVGPRGGLSWGWSSPIGMVPSPNLQRPPKTGLYSASKRLPKGWPGLRSFLVPRLMSKTVSKSLVSRSLVSGRCAQNRSSMSL